LRRVRVHLCGAADEIDSSNDELGREKRSKHEIGELRCSWQLKEVKR
jgi:hypothetical protein